MKIFLSDQTFSQSKLTGNWENNDINRQNLMRLELLQNFSKGNVNCSLLKNIPKLVSTCQNDVAFLLA